MTDLGPMTGWLLLLAGVILAGLGGELFVRGAVGLARWARVAPGIVGVTVAAFATSSPELAIGITSALSGVPEISLGDALGSNVTNIGLILGLVLCLGSQTVARDGRRRDYPVALLAPVAVGVLAVDGVLGRLDGIILLGLFTAWNVAVFLEVRRQRSAAGAVLGEPRQGLVILSILAGFFMLVAAGRFIVGGAEIIAGALGLSGFVVGATLVALGTSVPELATGIIAKLKGHDEVGLGTLLGSNIFNGLFIIGVVATIHPITVDWQTTLVALVFGMVTVALMVPRQAQALGRRRGVLLLLAYALYAMAVLQAGP